MSEFSFVHLTGKQDDALTSNHSLGDGSLISKPNNAVTAIIVLSITLVTSLYAGAMVGIGKDVNAELEHFSDQKR